MMLRRVRTGVVFAVAVAVFVCAWLLRFNDPSGSFAGLTDDHFFYLVRGWQILFGDLPVRDFVDQGAPLYYYVAAGVQQVFGRGTLSELAFSVTVLAFSAALVFWLAATASGSVLAGLLGTFFHLYLGPRFYNYPKILVYAVAVPLWWRFADNPSARARFWLALVTAAAFLFRHDHGVFVAAGTVVLLVLLPAMPWRERLRHAALYGVTSLVLLAPYLAFIQLHGGVLDYGRKVVSWAERERDRTPVVWPGLLDNPDGESDEARTASGVTRLVAMVRDNDVAWVYYLELVIPLVAIGLLAVSAAGLRPGWALARQKLALVAILALILDAGLLRSPLAARLADPSVPHAILIAWLAVALPRAAASSRWLAPRWAAAATLARTSAAAVLVVVAFLLGALLSEDFAGRLERSSFTGLRTALDRSAEISRHMRTEWRLDTWAARAERPATIDLALYVNACTQPDDRVFVQGYMPQVLALARRGFAGGHADLRPGFFDTNEDQDQTVERLARQAPPILLLESAGSVLNLPAEFPRVWAFVEREYVPAGTRQFERFEVTLFARRERAPSGTYQPIGWPCFGPGFLGP